MPHVITVSMGASAQDYEFETSFLGQDFRVSRQGADGDEERAWDLLRRAQADADANVICPSRAIVVFVAAQRFCMFAMTFGVAAYRRGARNVARAFTENVLLLFGLASLELYTMAAYLMALDHLYVSYAIAAKRSGILLSVVAGALFFDEKIAKRLPYVLVILVGMTLVLLAGDDGHDEARAGR